MPSILRKLRRTERVAKMVNNQLTDLRQLILCEIGDFCAMFGHPGEPETPEEIQRELTMRVGRILNDHILNYSRCEVLTEILSECRIARDAAQAELQEHRKAAAPQLPDIASFEVNDAAWKLHDMLRAHGPITGAQFNNLKGCFYEALKVAMKKSIATAPQSLNDAERTNTETMVAGSIFFSSPEELARAIAAVRCFDELSPELIAEEMFKGGAA